MVLHDPEDGLIMRICVIAGVMLIGAALPAFAQPAVVARDALACGDGNAVRALNDGTDPHHNDNHWRSDVVARGHCGMLPRGMRVIEVGGDRDLIQIVSSTAGEAGHLFLEASDISAKPEGQEAAASAAHVAEPPTAPASPWRMNTSADGLATCQLDSDATAGHVALVATAVRPGVVRLILRRPSWSFPANTLVHADVAFSDNAVARLVGTAEGNELAVELTDVTLPPFIQEFSGSRTATISFTSMRNEPAWEVNLHDAAPAVSVLSDCIRQRHIAASPPLGEAAPPVADVAVTRPAILPYPLRRPAGSPMTPLKAVRSPDVNRAYSQCLQTEVRTQHTADDNPDYEALVTMSQCIPQWRAWMKDCRKGGQATDKDCTAGSLRAAKSDLAFVAR
jgi:hypothetical protein